MVLNHHGHWNAAYAEQDGDAHSTSNRYQHGALNYSHKFQSTGYKILRAANSSGFTNESYTLQQLSVDGKSDTKQYVFGNDSYANHDGFKLFAKVRQYGKHIGDVLASLE